MNWGSAGGSSPWVVTASMSGARYVACALLMVIEPILAARRHARARQDAARLNESPETRNPATSVWPLPGASSSPVGAIAALVLNAFQATWCSSTRRRRSPRARAPASPGLPRRRAGAGRQRQARRREGELRRHRHRQDRAGAPTKVSCPDLFREGKGVVAQGQLKGTFVAREVLAKRRTTMPPERRGAQARPAGQRQGRQDGGGAGAANDSEIGHFALWLALGVARAGVVPLAGAQTGRAEWMALARPLTVAQFAAHRHRHA